MALKFVKNLVFTSGSSTARMSYFLKMMYEFLGFCVHGGTSTGTPGFGALAGSTTIAVASNGLSLPQATINVASTAASPTAGVIFVHTSTGTHAVTYTGKGATTFTGCVGGTGTMSTGNVVNSFAATAGNLTNIPGNFLGCATLVATASNGTSLSQTTTIAAGSNGAVLPQGTINVVSTTGFPTTGTIFVTSSGGQQLVTYTGVNATQFTGCTGGTGTMSTGGIVTMATVHVVSTATFPTTGTIYVYSNQGTQTVAYTGVTATTFTGCTGGAGTMTTGNNVTSNSLMTLGSDGYTNATTIFRQDGYTDFYATNIQFTSNMVGKQLVMWKSGSNSSEDSIYNIIGFKDQNNLVINVNNGGTPSGIVDGYRATVTTRSSINYRVIDVGIAGAATGIVDGSHMIFQVDPAGINTGQAVAQLQLIVANTNQRLDYNMSPNGSWTGTAFGVDASGTRQPNVGNAGITQQHQNTTSAGTMTVTMIADKDFIIGYGKDSNHGSSSGFHWHWEIPERLYTQTQDLNPFAVQLNGYGAINSNPLGPFYSVGTTYGYGGGFVMRDNAGTYRNYRTTVKAMIGDGDTNLLQVAATQLPKVPGNTLADFRAGANQFTGTLVNSAGFLTLPGVAGQYSLARVRLRRVRFANSFMRTFTRFSALTDWMLVQQGVSVPWDKTVMPLTIFPF